MPKETPIKIAKNISPSMFHNGIVAKFIVRKPINDSGKILDKRLSFTPAVIIKEYEHRKRNENSPMYPYS
ncbi:hypothetical protein KUL156_29190 [Alteromonas sp. KUL156]|nr:hypothetical protein KUL154_51590 [Alteromonas sp. KUL154]GFE00327.1 hypothetical protein KUL156_29190 [Alteromonas sp. KUL156]